MSFTPTRPALDLYHHLLGVALVILEVEDAVDARILALFLLKGSGARDETNRPFLELVAVLLCQRTRLGNRGRLADDPVIDTLFEVEHIAEAVLDECNRQMGDVDTDPAAVELLRRHNRRATATERVQHRVAFTAGGLDDTLQQREGFFGLGSQDALWHGRIWGECR
jgi:hypothetical protein